ncbi:hypothetical protein Zm00014a_019942 [Zea mays]|uniref:Uncharacterized protein n=1 Tax=Zea mays TaxID=4577 RepID=A0A3L6FML5_MAIZE|nr:hypothetical protein Zm00014a_019942 [Zea mays]
MDTSQDCISKLLLLEWHSIPIFHVSCSFHQKEIGI